jgi:hypothetical protein
MPEVDKQLNFNALHILLVTIVINFMLNNNINYIIDSINYIINLGTPGLWFLLLHILLFVIILSSLKFELGFRASIKLNL